MKTRIISAIIMILIVVPILFIGGLPFKILSIVLAMASMYEITKARGARSKIPTIIRIISYLLVGLFVYVGTSVYSANYELIYKIMIAIFLLYFIPVVLINDTSKYSITDAFYILSSTMFLGVAYNSFVLISNSYYIYLLYIILITVMTDTFAYFTGYFIGKHKMCEKISPKKTWEGAVGGSFVATIVATIYYMFIIKPDANLLLVIGITLLLTIVGQLGDLFFSSIKRHYNIKDFSNLIPGHGGILDRVDSIIFVVLTFTLLVGII